MGALPETFRTIAALYRIEGLKGALNQTLLMPRDISLVWDVYPARKIVSTISISFFLVFSWEKL